MLHETQITKTLKHTRPLVVPPVNATQPAWPTHLDLPDSDGVFVKNFQEHPQSILLTDSIWPILEHLHPDGHFCVGQDSGIYWRHTDPPEKGATAPGWFYVPNVPPTPEGQVRRSYVMWNEYIAPTIALEFVSGSGKEERDRTPYTGKFWIYEQVIRPAFYGIYEVNLGRVEVYYLSKGVYRRLPANQAGRYPIKPMGVELGIWNGRYQNMVLPWLRWWNEEGGMLLTGDERAILAHQRAEQEAQRAEQEAQRAEQEYQRAERLAAQLRALGIDPK